MRAGRITLLVLGALIGSLAFGVVVAGAGLGWAWSTGRTADGYFETPAVSLETDGYAIVSTDIDLGSRPGDWFPSGDLLDVRVTPTPSELSTVFVGIGPASEVDGYLAGVARDELIRFDGDRAVYERLDGTASPEPPTEQSFWVATNSPDTSGVLDWEVTAGDWKLVMMNADGAEGVTATVTAAADLAFVPFVVIGLILAGMVLAGISIALLIAGVAGYRAQPTEPVETAVPGIHPVAVTGRMDPHLNRGLWLVKWFLAIPHFIILGFLITMMVVLTLVAAVAILFTGRYPRGIFDFNVGVLRWSWRVSFYATGVIGTDRYPPFSLQPTDYPADLDVAYPERLSRWMVLVKWLLAIPHLLIVGVLTNGIVSWTQTLGDSSSAQYGTGLIGLLVIVAGLALLFTGRYPQALYDLLVGLNRWVYRVVAYIALMTDEYPPFRLDQGGSEPLPPSGAPDQGSREGAAVEVG